VEWVIVLIARNTATFLSANSSRLVQIWRETLNVYPLAVQSLNSPPVGCSRFQIVSKLETLRHYVWTGRPWVLPHAIARTIIVFVAAALVLWIETFANAASISILDVPIWRGLSSYS